MTTTIRHVTLKSLGKNKDIDPSKGTVVNPFTQGEYNSLCHTGEWTGGYVEAMGYVAPPMMDGMGDGSGSGSDDGFDSGDDSSMVYYEGIHVSAGSSHAYKNLYGSMEAGIEVEWTDGYTGTANVKGRPGWIESTINVKNAIINKSQISVNNNTILLDVIGTVRETTTKWRKNCINNYTLVVTLKYDWSLSDINGHTITKSGNHYYLDGVLLDGITQINNTETVDIGIDNPSFVFS